MTALRTELAALREQHEILAAELKEEASARYWGTVRREEYFEPPRAREEGE